MISMRNGWVVVGCIAVGFVTSAGPSVVARAAEPLRWAQLAAATGGGVVTGNSATPAPSESQAQQRILQLEQRVKELEAERHAQVAADPAHGNSPELDAAIAQNDELTARNRKLTAENQALAQSHLFEQRVSARACEPPPGDADPKVQIRYWAERLRDGDGHFHDRLTADQNAALNVLLRRERELDPRNPWREM